MLRNSFFVIVALMCDSGSEAFNPKVPGKAGSEGGFKNRRTGKFLWCDMNTCKWQNENEQNFIMKESDNGQYSFVLKQAGNLNSGMCLDRVSCSWWYSGLRLHRCDHCGALHWGYDGSQLAEDLMANCVQTNLEGANAVQHCNGVGHADIEFPVTPPQLISSTLSDVMFAYNDMERFMRVTSIETRSYCNGGDIEQSFSVETQSVEDDKGTTSCFKLEAGVNFSADLTVYEGIPMVEDVSGTAHLQLTGSTSRTNCETSTTKRTVTITFPHLTLPAHTSEDYRFVKAKATFDSVPWNGTLTNVYADSTVILFVHGSYTGVSFGSIKEYYTNYKKDVHTCGPDLVTRFLEKARSMHSVAFVACAAITAAVYTVIVARRQINCASTSSAAPLLAA